jgi:hypothetical protein
MSRNQRVMGFRLTLVQGARIRYWGNYVIDRTRRRRRSTQPAVIGKGVYSVGVVAFSERRKGKVRTQILTTRLQANAKLKGKALQQKISRSG